jgi:hypothetical protein
MEFLLLLPEQITITIPEQNHGRCCETTNRCNSYSGRCGITKSEEMEFLLLLSEQITIPIQEQNHGRCCETTKQCNSYSGRCGITKSEEMEFLLPEQIPARRIIRSKFEPETNSRQWSHH